MSFGFGKTNNLSVESLDNNDLQEIKKICEMLNPDEEYSLLHANLV